MTAKQLKNSILQMAVQGKLVPQDSNDEPASVLLERIRAEKQRLIKEGKIKKEKPLPPINEDDIPFDVPKTWEWVRLGDYLDVRDGTHDTPKYVPKGIPLITSKNLKDGKIDYDNVKFISEDDHIAISRRSKVDDGDILFAMIGSIGNPVVVNKVCEFSIKNVALFKPVLSEKIDMKYVFYFLSLAQEWLKREASGGVQSFVSLKYFRNYLFPLPPIAEQQRIVERIEQLLPHIADYDIAEQKLTALNTTFPDQLKKSILQAAVQGKLVEQNENDEPASVLLERIRAEKEQFIKEGKSKKEKPLPPITDDEIPFNVPESWEWVRLGALLNKLTDGAHHTPKYTESGVPFLSVKDISDGKLCFSNTKFISKEEHEELYKRCNPEKGDILLTKVGTTGIPVLVDTDKEFSLFVSVALLKFNQELLCGEYLVKLLESPLVKTQCTENTRGVGNKNWVIRDIANTLVVLPPITEQRRIVAKCEELLAMVEGCRASVG